MTQSNQTPAQRTWATSEEADLSTYKHEEFHVEVWEDSAMLYRKGKETVMAQIFPVGENLYLCHLQASSLVQFATSLEDIIKVAQEELYQA